MKKRSLQILNLLLNAKQGISGKALASKLQVSARTVRNDINEINAELSAAHCQIHSSPALGYSIENEEKERILSFLKLKEASLSFYPDTPSERELYLSLRLLLSDSQAHSIETLADSIYVSKTTVFSDIRHLNEGCGKTFAFEIIFSASSGISFSGKERNLRRFLSYLISHHYESNLPYLKQIIKYFLHCQDALLFALYDEIMQILDGLSIVLTDKDLFLFIIEYLITLRRSQLGYPLEKEDAAAPDTCFFHFPYERLQAITHIFASVEDARYLDDCFSLKHFLTNHNDMIKDELSASIIAQYLELLKKDYRIDLSDDTMLKENLIRHLNTMLRRIRLNDVSEAAFLSDIKQLYPYSFELASAILPIIKQTLNKTISEAELSYIAIHLTAILDQRKPKYNAIIVCGSGLGTAQLITVRLQNYFSSQINILCCCPLYQAAGMLEKYKETDFILTTVPLELDTATPIIKISPFFTKEDFLTLSSVISKQMTPAPLKKEAALLDADLFFIEQAEADKDQILKKMIHQLYACGYIDSFPAFYASVIERENLYSTVFDHIWMPHPMRGLSKTTVVAIAVIEHAKEIQMIFLCAINPKETPRFQELYRKISRIMDEPSLFDSLHHARSFSAFATLFESL